MEIIWSLGVTDNTEHYECFVKGSNPLETSNKVSLVVEAS